MVDGTDGVVLVDDSDTADDSAVGVMDSEAFLPVEASGCLMLSISGGTGVVDSEFLSSVEVSGCPRLGTSCHVASKSARDRNVSERFWRRPPGGSRGLQCLRDAR